MENSHDQSLMDISEDNSCLFLRPEKYLDKVMTFENESPLTNSTTMSLDQRFTQLRNETATRGRGGRGGGLTRRMSVTDLRVDTLRQASSASAKSRRLALQMSQRPSVIAALNGVISNRRGNFGGGLRRGGGQLRGRVGRGGGGVMRTIGNRRALGGSPGGNRLKRSSSVGRLSRSGSVGRLSRSQSLQSLNNIRATSPSPFRGRGGGRGGRGGRRGGRGRGRGGNAGSNDFVIGSGTLSGVRTGRVGQPPRGRGRGRGQRGFNRRTDGFVQRQGSRGGFNQNRFQQQNRGRGGQRGGAGGNFQRGRGNRGGRGGRGGGGRPQGQGPPPSKEKLDMELDEYMSATKSNLDKEIDSYMSKTEEVWEV